MNRSLNNLEILNNFKGYCQIVGKTHHLQKLSVPNNYDPVCCEHFYPRAESELIVIVGGGFQIDRLKKVTKDFDSEKNILVIPTLFGSGAEVSSVCVVNENDKKIIYNNSKYLPEYYYYSSSFIETWNLEIIKNGIGDLLSHFYEGILSPLRKISHEDKITEFYESSIRQITKADLFSLYEISNQANKIQLEASVGLIHSIAHIVEPKLINVGHACICRNLLLPVMSYNLRSPIVKEKLMKFGISEKLVIEQCRSLFDKEQYSTIYNTSKKHWSEILSDPFSKLNSSRVKTDAIKYLEQFLQ